MGGSMYNQGFSLDGSCLARPLRNLLSLNVHVISEAEIEALILHLASKGHGLVVTYATAYTLVLAHQNKSFADTLNLCDLCYPDGVGIGIVNVLLGQGTMPKTTANRFFLPLCDRAIQSNLSLALLGSQPGVAGKVAEVIRQRNKSSVKIFTADGFTGTDRFAELSNALAKLQPNVVFVAMGQPKQECTALQLRCTLPNSIILCVGGLFDVISGVLPSCPEWLRSIGLEWAFRLSTRPRKVWRRYLIGIPVLLWAIARGRLRMFRS
ncbi:MAG: WecB/TagA/CpsF family glycosyltransferase [Limisphaerales bacterium]